MSATAQHANNKPDESELPNTASVYCVIAFHPSLHLRRPKAEATARTE